MYSSYVGTKAVAQGMDAAALGDVGTRPRVVVGALGHINAHGLRPAGVGKQPGAGSLVAHIGPKQPQQGANAWGTL